MFDIKEYYQNDKYNPKNMWENISDIDEDINRDVDSLLTNRFDNLYLKDRFKNNNISMDIIYPRLTYPGNKSVMISPDKIRFLLSFYPDKEDLKIIQKIVIRPRYFEIDTVELVSLFLKKKKILILYLTHPFFYKLEEEGQNKKFISTDIQNFIRLKLMGNKINSKETYKIKAHPLWYIISTLCKSCESGNLSAENEGKIDKFFVKKNAMDTGTFQNLNDISLYYSRHGY